jgi:hypothetical protein
MLKTEQSPGRRAAEVAILGMVLTIRMARVRSTLRAVRMGPREGREPRTGRRK